MRDETLLDEEKEEEEEEEEEEEGEEEEDEVMVSQSGVCVCWLLAMAASHPPLVVSMRARKLERRVRPAEKDDKASNWLIMMLCVCVRCVCVCEMCVRCVCAMCVCDVCVRCVCAMCVCVRVCVMCVCVMCVMCACVPKIAQNVIKCPVRLVNGTKLNLLGKVKGSHYE